MPDAGAHGRFQPRVLVPPCWSRQTQQLSQAAGTEAGRGSAGLPRGPGCPGGCSVSTGRCARCQHRRRMDRARLASCWLPARLQESSTLPFPSSPEVRVRNHGVHVLISAGRAHPEKVSSRQCPGRRRGGPRAPLLSVAGTSSPGRDARRHEEGAV